MLVLKTLKNYARLIEPSSAEEFRQLFHLRWEMLRKPWGLIPGSEQDELENSGIHRAVVLETGSSRVVACGRLHSKGDGVSQIRYMAVDAAFQGQGYGLEVLRSLEEYASEHDFSEIFLHARENALPFYLKAGYTLEMETEPFLGIRHFRMSRKL